MGFLGSRTGVDVLVGVVLGLIGIGVEEIVWEAGLHAVTKPATIPCVT